MGFKSRQGLLNTRPSFGYDFFKTQNKYKNCLLIPHEEIATKHLVDQ